MKRSNCERGVGCGETPVNQSSTRHTLMAAAVATCGRCVRGSPIDRARRNPIRRTRFRRRAFDPCPLLRDLSKLRSLLPLTCGFERFIGFAPSHAQGASPRLRTLRPYWTGSTGRVRELAFAHLLIACFGGRPTEAFVPLWTAVVTWVISRGMSSSPVWGEMHGCHQSKRLLGSLEAFASRS